MKEVELVGTIEEVYEKLKTHVGQKICEYDRTGRYESTLLEVDSMDGHYIYMTTDLFGFRYGYCVNIDPPIFFCLEEDEVLETFDEMVKRKQKEMFKEKCY